MQIGERAYQSFSPEVRQSSDGKKTVFKISTSGKDRHETIIEAAGVDVSAFNRNPVVLFNHDYDRVIGRASNVQVRGDYLIAEVEFDEEDPDAANIGRKVKAGFLNGASIGFMIKEWTMDEADDTMRITACELVEFSVVAVPSNRDALVMSRDLRQQVESLQAELEAMKASREITIEGKIEGNANDLLQVVRKSNAARQAPADTTEEAGEESPAEAVADAIPEPEAAKQETPEPEAERAAPQTARQATAADYEAMAKAMQPVILQSVLRALGKA